MKKMSNIVELSIAQTRKDAIELCQKRITENIELFGKVRKDADMLKTIEAIYINQLWVMQALNIILEDMKE